MTRDDAYAFLGPTLARALETNDALRHAAARRAAEIKDDYRAGLIAALERTNHG